MASPVRQAIRDRLAGDATLIALLAAGANGIHYRLAPEGALEPLVVFDKVDGRPTWTFKSTPVFETDLWLVKGISHGKADEAEAIAARLDIVLNDAPLTITGQTPLYVRKQSGVDFGEQDRPGADMYHHAGAVYRLVRSSP